MFSFLRRLFGLDTLSQIPEGQWAAELREKLDLMVSSGSELSVLSEQLERVRGEAIEIDGQSKLGSGIKTYQKLIALLQRRMESIVAEGELRLAWYELNQALAREINPAEFKDALAVLDLDPRDPHLPEIIEEGFRQLEAER